MSSRKYIWHIAFWIGYMVVEYLANIYHIRPGNEWMFVKSILLNLPFIMGPSYFMALYVVPKFIKQNRVVPASLSIIGVGVFVFYGRLFWLIQMSHFDWTMFTDPPMGKLWKNTIRDYSVIALATCVYLLADWRERQQRTEALIKAKAEAELMFLKGQLQPHFLFNTLNNIYSLSLTGSEMTSDAILKLTELLEYLVYFASKEKVPIRTELSLINNYLDLEALRHQDNLVVEKVISVSNPNLEVAPLILLPFVENCFKHGGPNAEGIFRIEYRVECSNEELLFELVNTIGNNFTDEITGGVGLANVRKRLDLAYETYALETGREGSQYHVLLKVHLQS